MRQPVEVLIVDDHPSVRHGLQSVLRARGFAVVGTAATAEEAERVIHETQPDVAVIDLVLGGDSGDELVKRIQSSLSPGTATLLCTGFVSRRILARAEASSADGFVSKLAPIDELVDGIRAVARGERVADAHIGKVLRVRADRSVLTPREREVLALLARGHGAASIAARLFISRETVHTHVRNAIRGLGARNRVHAVALAASMGEIELPRSSESAQ